MKRRFISFRSPDSASHDAALGISRLLMPVAITNVGINNNRAALTSATAVKSTRLASM